MSNYPDDLRYTEEHEWVRLEGTTATIGITQFAVEQLGDITMVDFQTREGEKVRAKDAVAAIESVKAVSDVFSPVSGKVLKTNDPLSDEPEMLNEDCYDDGWILQLEVSDPAEVQQLMSASAYEKYLKEQEA